MATAMANIAGLKTDNKTSAVNRSKRLITQEHWGSGIDLDPELSGHVSSKDIEYQYDGFNEMLTVQLAGRRALFVAM